MSGLSLNGRDQSAAAWFLPGLFDAPTSVWLALTTVLPTPGDTGIDLVEPVDAAYGRQELGVGPDWWTLTGRGGVTTIQDALFAEPTQDWDMLVGWALCSDSDGGATYFVGELDAPERIYYDPAVLHGLVVGAGAIVVKFT